MKKFIIAVLLPIAGLGIFALIKDVGLIAPLFAWLKTALMTVTYLGAYLLLICVGMMLFSGASLFILGDNAEDTEDVPIA